jgi:energy-coupling factor transport system ATP-binding protein
LIRFEDVHYRYPGSDWVLRGIDLELGSGEYLLVCGANGSGKSTFGYLFNGLVPHFFSGTLTGRVTVEGIDTRQRSTADLFASVGLVLQNTDAQLFNGTVEGELAYGLESLGLPSSDIDRRVKDTASRLGIADLLPRTPSDLSGGEKRLVAVASILSLDPSVMVLDEPYANLDWEGAGRLRKALREIHRDGTTVVLIEQILNGFLREAGRCLVFERGKIVHDGGTVPAEGAISLNRLIPHYPPLPETPGRGETLLAVENLSFRRGEKEILRNISFEIGAGETVAIVGKNGSGKTTLIKHLNGLLTPSAGRVRFKGSDIRGEAPLERAAAVGLCFQNANDQFFKERVRDELRVGARLLGSGEAGWLDKISEIFHLRHLLDRSPFRLSEGEKKRVAVSSILAMKPSLLVLDEPTVGQDGRFRELLASFLADLRRLGFAILIVTHDLDFARAAASRWMVLHGGKLAADGAPARLLGDAGLKHIGALPPSEEPA